jgi:hypothetical protein
MTASISIADIGIFALCVGLGLGWVMIVHRFLKNSGEGEAADRSVGSPAGSGH